MLDAIKNFLANTGIAILFSESNWWQYIVMYLIVGVLFYLAIVKKFEPLLLMPIAFGMLLANLPGAELIHLEFFFDDYYIAINEEKEIIGILSQQVTAFLDNVRLLFGDSAFEIIAKTETTNGKIIFTETI